MTWARAKTATLVAIAFGVVAVAAVFVAAWVTPISGTLERPSSQVIKDTQGGWLRVFTTADGGGMLRIPVSRRELPDVLVEAVIAFEDKRFRRHLGVDPIAVARAAWLNVTRGRVVSGGSTITMQVARMMDPRPRTLSAKVAEAFRALQLELRMTKDEILTAYFNLAPYGGNLEGVGAAAYFYFEKEPSELGLDEAATLAVLPNAPGRLRPGRADSQLKLRRDEALARMLANGFIDELASSRARAMPIHARRRSSPSRAPHLASWLHQRHPDRTRLVTTLDPAMQHRVERLLGDHLDGLRPRGIENGAVVVIDNETRAVRAYVGSAAFFDTATDGQVDGARGERSPGSTLKPFVYAMGLDEGAVGMNTLLEDSPLHLGDWSPVNFDEKFHGMVSVRTALSESLNIPAVRLAAKLGRDRLQGLLARAGLSTFSDPRRHYGLAAVLGGCEVTLLELTNLYASLAQLGLHKPYRVLEDEPVGQGRRLFSEGAAYLVTDILTDVRRPELQEVYESSVSLPRVAWKTGTSYGRRDAWSIGYTRRFTVGVWVGNFDGRGVPELVGARAAAPLLFAVAQVLPGVSTERWLEAPSSVVQREVCTVSGLPAAADCPHTRSELAIEEVTPRGRCQMHVRMAVSDDAGHRLCGACRSEHPHHSEVHVQWPASAVPWLESNGVVTSIPQHNPSCPRVTNGTGPVIHTPLDGDRYVMRDGVPADRQQIGLLASSGDGGGGEIFWFVDGALLTRGQSGRPALMNPSPGAHQVVAVDAEGRTAAIQIHIR